MLICDAFPHPYHLKDAQAFIKMALEMNPVTFFAIEYNSEYAGNIGIFPGQDVYRKSAEIGYFLGEPYWHKGIMPEAVRLMIKFAFNDLDLVRLHCGIYEYNHASMRVVEKCGFVKEGIFRKSIFKNGKLWDEHRYALLRGDVR